MTSSWGCAFAGRVRLTRRKRSRQGGQLYPADGSASVPGILRRMGTIALRPTQNHPIALGSGKPPVKTNQMANSKTATQYPKKKKAIRL